jgi:hypothetical protein
MAEVINRAARRAAGTGKDKVNIKVTNRVNVVPMPQVESYYTHEIASEGKWRDDVPVIVLSPTADRGEADCGWFPRTLAQMRDVRERVGQISFRISVDEEIDITDTDHRIWANPDHLE